MKKKINQVTRGNIRVKIYPTETFKNGRKYTSYVVSDYSGGSRKLWTFADLEEAKLKADDLAEAIANGDTDIVRLRNWRFEVRKAMEAVESTHLTIPPACQLFAQAVRILGSSDSHRSLQTDPPRVKSN